MFETQIMGMEQVVTGAQEVDDEFNADDLEKKLAKTSMLSLRRRLCKVKMEYLNKATIKKIAKPCPKCKIPIEKSGG